MTTQPRVLEPRQDDMASYLDEIETGAPVVLIMRRWDMERPAAGGGRWSGRMDAVAAYRSGEPVWEEHSADNRWDDATFARMVERALVRLARA